MLCRCTNQRTMMVGIRPGVCPVAGAGTCPSSLINDKEPMLIGIRAGACPVANAGKPALAPRP